MQEAAYCVSVSEKREKVEREGGKEKEGKWREGGREEEREREWEREKESERRERRKYGGKIESRSYIAFHQCTYHNLILIR